MPIDVTRNERPTIGIEVELHLVDTSTGALVSAADELPAILATGSGTRRQRRLVERGGTLVDVVHHLANELLDDHPLPSHPLP